MNKLLQSKLFTAAALALCILSIILTFSIRKEQWWMFIDIFFIFMAIFSHLMSLTIVKLNEPASRKLDIVAFRFLILGVIAFIAEWIAFSVLF